MMWLSCCYVFFVLVQCGSLFSSGLDPLDEKVDEKLLKNFNTEWNSTRVRKCVNHRVFIPYQIYNFSQENQNAIHESLDQYSSQTCLTFREVGSVKTEVDPQFENNTGLYFSPSSIDYPYPVQLIQIDRREIYELRFSENIPFNYTVARAMQQVYYGLMGFLPEHTRPDRDNYVTVVWQNIRPGKIFRDLFEKQYDVVSSVPYDLKSISNFYPNDYGIDEKETLKSKNEELPLKRNTQLSDLDVYKITARYCETCAT